MLNSNPGSTTVTTENYPLEYPGGDVNLGIAPKDEIKLLEVLKNAGMRTV